MSQKNRNNKRHDVIHMAGYYLKAEYPFTSFLLWEFIKVGRLCENHRNLEFLIFATHLGKFKTMRNIFRLFTARKRSLGQGNIFIGVCQEFCSRGGGHLTSRHPSLEQTPHRADPPVTKYTARSRPPPGLSTLPMTKDTPRD